MSACHKLKISHDELPPVYPQSPTCDLVSFSPAEIADYGLVVSVGLSPFPFDNRTEMRPELDQSPFSHVLTLHPTTSNHFSPFVAQFEDPAILFPTVSVVIVHDTLFFRVVDEFSTLFTSGIPTGAPDTATPDLAHFRLFLTSEDSCRCLNENGNENE